MRVPARALEQGLQPGDQHLGADALHAVHAAEEADGGRAQVVAADLQAPHRQRLAVDVDGEHELAAQALAVLVHQCVEIAQFGEGWQIHRCFPRFEFLLADDSLVTGV